MDSVATIWWNLRPYVICSGFTRCSVTRMHVRPSTKASGQSLGRGQCCKSPTQTSAPKQATHTIAHTSKLPGHRSSNRQHKLKETRVAGNTHRLQCVSALRGAVPASLGMWTQKIQQCVTPQLIHVYPCMTWSKGSQAVKQSKAIFT